MPHIACPECHWRPRSSARWRCDCGHVWNTFRTTGRCPSCDKQWDVTVCLNCKELFPHMDFYHEKQPPAFIVRFRTRPLAEKRESLFQQFIENVDPERITKTLAKDIWRHGWESAWKKASPRLRDYHELVRQMLREQRQGGIAPETRIRAREFLSEPEFKSLERQVPGGKFTGRFDGSK